MDQRHTERPTGRHRGTQRARFSGPGQTADRPNISRSMSGQPNMKPIIRIGY